jgi:hypothetical protein
MNCCGTGFGYWHKDSAGRSQNSESEPRISGNQAFDEYRAATLRRLEEEQREFREFLSRLRMAEDKAEFDQFMVARRARSESAQSQG